MTYVSHGDITTRAHANIHLPLISFHFNSHPSFSPFLPPSFLPPLLVRWT